MGPASQFDDAQTGLDPVLASYSISSASSSVDSAIWRHFNEPEIQGFYREPRLAGPRRKVRFSSIFFIDLASLKILLHFLFDTDCIESYDLS